MTLIRAALLVLAAALAAPAAAFDFEDVSRRARALAAKAHKPPDAALPAVLRDMSYDAYRDIRFRADHALWRNAGLPFEVQFFHPGFLFQHTVPVNVISAQGVKPVPFNPDAFSYGRNAIDRKQLRKLGFAGFRIHHAINRPDYKDEITVFLGASYLRAVGRGHGYGLSARGLAIDTALPSGEEFPAFREFWIEWPAPNAREIVVYALLDSRRAAGAYRFVIRPGEATTMDVRARLFLRDHVGKLGLAPLSSMYFFGENQPSPVEDYRPEVHDSDGLLVASGTGEWIWRPLVNPRRLLVTSFALAGTRGFGLLQRDRAFPNYEDLEARYERRPSVWIEPQAEWGPGRVELVQIPTADEFNDNIVAYWVPERAPRSGDALEYSYDLFWQMHEETLPALARVTQTRRGHGWLPGESDDSLRFHLDFEGGPLAELPPDTIPVAGIWVGDGGELLERQLYRNEVSGGWRLSMRVRRTDETRPLEMRAILRHGEDTLSETWAYALPPAATR